MTDLIRARRLLRQSLVCLRSAEHQIAGGYVAVSREHLTEIREHLAADIAAQEAEIRAEKARERNLELADGELVADEMDDGTVLVRLWSVES